MTSWGSGTPAGAGRDADRAAPAGHGSDPIAAWKAALAAHGAARRRGRHRRAARQPRAGSFRLPPPGGDDAA